MTIDQIDAVQAQANVEYDVAKRIREILDTAAEQYGAAHWDDDSMESEFLELVSSDQ
jgi:hypothetical protein